MNIEVYLQELKRRQTEGHTDGQTASEPNESHKRFSTMF